MSVRISASTKRKLPRPFSFHWGKGSIIKEASIRCSINGATWEPTIQLLCYEDGREVLRFCVYHGTRFTRMPPLIGEKELEGLRRQAARQPQLNRLLRKLLE